MEAVQSLDLPDDENPYRTSFDLAEKGVPDLDPASVRLKACQHFQNEGNYVDALAEAQAGRVLAQEALVSAVEVYGYMPVSMVATLVVAYYNIGYQHVNLNQPDDGRDWYSKALEMAEMHLTPQHTITQRIRTALEDLLDDIEDEVRREEIRKEAAKSQARKIRMIHSAVPRRPKTAPIHYGTTAGSPPGLDAAAIKAAKERAEREAMWPSTYPR